jgi:hypothetical protein
LPPIERHLGDGAKLIVNEKEGAMDEEKRAIVLDHCKQMSEALKKALAEEPKTEAEIEALLAYIERTTAPKTDPEVHELMMLELREAARASHKGPDTVQ